MIFRSLVLVWLSLAVLDSVRAQSADALYVKRCLSCHGNGALGKEVTGAPALAGQDATYLERQLENFANGLRGRHKKDAFGAAMAPWAQSLDQAERTEISAYLSQLPPLRTASSPNDAELAQGKKTYQANCGSCHGADGQGNKVLNSPNLVSLSLWYSKRQYQHFVAGIRGGDKADKLGYQMHFIASRLSDEKRVADVLAYIDSLK